MRCTGSPEKNERKKLDKILTSLKNKIEQKMFKNILAKKNLTFQLMFIQKDIRPGEGGEGQMLAKMALCNL